MYHDKSQPFFAGKLFRLLPRPTRSCPKDIGYHEITAYGELLYRSRLDLKTTLTDLATTTGCERWHTLPKVVKRLREHGLADERLRPLPDEQKFFHRKKTQKRRWQDQLQTTTIYRLVPDAELTDIQNAVLWTIHSFNSTGQRPHVRSVAKLLRLDYRTVDKHLKWLQEHGYLDADLSVCADPRHWQDAAPRLPGDPEARWDDFAAEWVASRYDDGYNERKPRFAIAYPQVRRSLHDGCADMAQAGYTSVQIRDYWERVVPDACQGDFRLVLMEYFVERIFYKMFPAIEGETNRNRQLGKFHGQNSLGLLRQATAVQARTMKARLMERGIEGLESWCPDFSSLGTIMRPKARNVVSRVSEPKAENYSPSERRGDRESFERMLRKDAPELDCDLWLARIMGSQQFRDDPEQFYLDCYHAVMLGQAEKQRT